MRIKKLIKSPSHYIGFNLEVILKKRENTMVAGVGNKIGSRYVPFLDYDYHDRTGILAELRSLQERYSLGNAYLFRTKKGFHAIFLDLISFDLLLEVLEHSSCDRAYKYVPLYDDLRLWVLRHTPKKDNEVVFETVLYNTQVRPVSSPHAHYLKLRGVPEHILTSFTDKYEEIGAKIPICTYET